MTTPHDDDVLLRTARAEDDAALVRLAALDSGRPPVGPALLAEQNGAIVAALCLSTGRAVADPFVQSLHLVELLRRHAARRQRPAAAQGGQPLLRRLALRRGSALVHHTISP